MGTTKTALKAADGLALTWVLAIEGHDVLFGTGATAAAIVTAWGGTDWSTAELGLEPPGVIRQSFQPFRESEIGAEALTFLINSDALAEVVFASQKSSGAISKLEFDSVPNDSTIEVKTAGDFAASGDAFVGVERFTYTSIAGGDTFQSSAANRGKYAPFSRDGDDNWGRLHKLTAIAGVPVHAPQVTDYPRDWIGKWVGLYAHKSSGGVLDTKAQAELIFAGRISDIGEEQDGRVRVVCLDVRDALRTTVLLQDQFISKPQPGRFIYAPNAIEFRAFIYNAGVLEHADDGSLTIGVEGSGTEIEQGLNTADDLIDGIQEWLMATAGFQDRWHATIRPNGHAVIAVRKVGVDRRIEAYIKAPISVLNTLGWLSGDIESVSDPAIGYGKIETSEGEQTDPMAQFVSSTPVLEYSFTMPHLLAPDDPQRMYVGDPRGTFVDQRADLPPSLIAVTEDDAGDKWGLLDMGGQAVVLAREVLDGADLDYFEVHYIQEISFALGIPENRNNVTDWGFQRGEAAPIVRQIIWIQGDAATIVPRIFASTGTTNYNNGTYDDLAASLGAAIPWSLLGAPFLTSVTDFFADDAPTFTLLLDRPTKLSEILESELLLRGGHIAIRDGAIVFLTPPAATAGSAIHALTEANKGAAPDRQGENRAAYKYTRDTLVNHIKVEFGRTFDDRYRDVIDITNEQSRTDFGIAKPITIKARNYLGGAGPGTDQIREIIFELASFALSMFARPLLVVRRSTDYSLFNMVAGDLVTLTDSHVRDPQDGTHGIVALGGVCLSHEFNWQTRTGLCSVLLAGDDRRAIYSPCAEVDETAVAGGFDAGYAAGTSTIRCYASRHSLSSEDADATHFDDGEEIRIVEISPTAIAAPVEWIRTVSSQAGNDIVLTAALAAPAWDNTLKYRVTSVLRSAADATQQTDCYLADDADDLIEDVQRSRIYSTQGSDTTAILIAGDATRPHEYPLDDGTWETEGYPVHPGMHRAAIDTANNLTEYRTAPMQPWYLQTAATTTSATYQVVASYPFYTGAIHWVTGERAINFQLLGAISDAAEKAEYRITASAGRPSGDTMVADGIPAPRFDVETSLTGTTNDQASSVLTVEVVRIDADSPVTNLTVEMRTTDGVATATFYGVMRSELGPVT